jgi:hypothetical protein
MRCPWHKKLSYIQDSDTFPTVQANIAATLWEKLFGNRGKLTVPQRWFLGGENFDDHCVDS